MDALESKATLDSTIAGAKTALDEIADRLKVIIRDQSSESITEFTTASEGLIEKFDGALNKVVAQVRELIGEADLQGWEAEITIPPIKIRLSKPPNTQSGLPVIPV